MIDSSYFKPCSQTDFPEDITELNDWTGDDVWNAVLTVQLGELVEHGVFDWSKDFLDWSEFAYDENQYERVCAYFIERFRYREISIEPFRQWADRLMYKIKYELMPKYKPLYKRFDEGINPLQESDEYTKRRTIGSDYPETLLSANSDYISDGEDEESEKLIEGSISELLENYADRFRYVDELFLDELECLFVGLYTVNVNAY